MFRLCCFNVGLMLSSSGTYSRGCIGLFRVVVGGLEGSCRYLQGSYIRDLIALLGLYRVM